MNQSKVASSDICAVHTCHCGRERGFFHERYSISLLTGPGHETVYEIGRGTALALPHHAAEPAPEPGLPLLLDSILQHRWRYLARLGRLTRRRQKREDLTTEMYSLKLLSQHRYMFRVKFSPFLIIDNIVISIQLFRAPYLS